MVLHLFNDEKFVDAAIQHFEEVLPSKNLYLIFKEHQSAALNLVKTKENVRVVPFVPTGASNLDLQSIDVICVHYLDKHKLDFLSTITQYVKAKIVWFFWGADGFTLQKFDRYLLQTETKKIKLPGFKEFARRQLRVVLDLASKAGFNIQDWRPDNQQKIKFIRDRVDFIVPVIPEDYSLFVAKYKTRAKLIEWNYLSIEQMLKGEMGRIISGENILLGNSATKTNNHIEVLNRLSKVELGSRKIYVPLNYGDPAYRDYIVKYGSYLLPNHFVPLTRFMTLAEYNEILYSCSIVVMNHNRQQAMGNIISTLWMGASMFLNRESPVFKYLINLGCTVYTIDELASSNALARKPGDAEIIENRNALVGHWGRSAIQRKTISFFQQVGVLNNVLE